jgi:hypothetical protein
MQTTQDPIENNFFSTVLSVNSKFRSVTSTFNNEKSNAQNVDFFGSNIEKIFYGIDNQGITVDLADFSDLIKFKIKGKEANFADYTDDLIPHRNISIKLRNKLANNASVDGAVTPYYWKFEFIVSNKNLTSSDK